jgi:catechol 2,3-dioxygenase-like lactoylglutathione lyase family enzyme
MKQLNHIGIYVNDLAKMKQFYCDALGMSVAEEKISKGDFIRIALGIEEEMQVCKLISQNGNMIELCQYDYQPKQVPDSNRVWQNGVMHIAINVENLEALYLALKERGILFLSAPQIIGNNVSKACFCQDPEGNYLELIECLS